MTISLVLADPYELVRKGIASLLAGETDIEVLAECANGVELYDAIAQSRPDVAVIDSTTPGLEGFDIIRRLNNLLPTLRIIVLSDERDEEFVRGVLDAGAVGYLIKSGKSDELIYAIRHASREKVYLRSGLREQQQKRRFGAVDGDGGARLRRYVGPERRRSERRQLAVQTIGRALSRREIEVLKLVAEGKGTKEIALLLGISETTVKTHRNHVKEKLSVNNTAGMIRYALGAGLVSF